MNRPTLFAISFLFLFLLSLPAGAIVSIQENQHFELSGSVYSVVAHDSYKFEPERKSFAGINAVVRESHARGIPVIELSAEVFKSDSAPAVEYYVQSAAGQHGLRLLNNTTLIVSGGNLSQCLCETMRDFIRNSSVDLNIVLVASAIYDHSALWLGPVAGNQQLLLEDLLPVTSQYPWPNFISGFFDKNVLGISKAMCPWQNYLELPPYPLADFNISFSLDGKTLELKPPRRGVESTRTIHFSVLREN